MKIIFLFLISLLSFNSCDLLRFSKFEITSWSPGDGYHSAPENITVSLNFSNDPNRASIERNFSLTGDGSRVRGNFLWENHKLTFVPLVPLEKNTDYTITLSADAHNTEGLSMDEAFYADFTTRPANIRPVLTSCYPPMYAEVSDARMKIILQFSIPVPLRTLYDNVFFSPSMTGIWHQEDDDKRAVFTPAEPWAQKNRYEIRISSSLTDNNGMNIGNEFLSIFTTETDREPLCLLFARRITKNNNYIQLTDTPVENQDWEKDDRLMLVFSRPVDSLLVRNYISAEDGPNLVMETSSGFNSELIFRFDSPPVYESRFTIRIKPGLKDNFGNESKEEYVFRIFANGIFSKPPALAGIRMPVKDDLFFAESNSLYKIIPITDDFFHPGTGVNTWIELYFDTAPGASVDIFSLMELFRIETSNNVISFSPRHVKVSDFTINEPHWENFQRIEVLGNLVNTTNFGIINIQIGAGLRDSFGSKNEKSQIISLIK